MDIEIIKKLHSIVEITHNPLDFILIEDLLEEYRSDFFKDSYGEQKIKKIIYNFLKTNVQLTTKYSSKVFGKYNKRGYIGITWIDKTKIKTNDKHYHLFRHYDINKLKINKEERNKFFNEVDQKMFNINWPPVNLLFYIKVLYEDLNNSLEELKNL